MSVYDVPNGDDALEKLKQLVAAAPSNSHAALPMTDQAAQRASLKRDAQVLNKPRATTRHSNTKKASTTSSGGIRLTTTDYSDAFAQFNRDVFSRDRVALAGLGNTTILSTVQVPLTGPLSCQHVMSTCNHFWKQLEDSQVELHNLQSVRIHLQREIDLEKANRESAILSKEAKNASLREQVSNLSDQLTSLKDDLHKMSAWRDKLQQQFDCQHHKFLVIEYATTIHKGWLDVCDFKLGISEKWDAIKAEEDYHEVMKIESDLNREAVSDFVEHGDYAKYVDAPASVAVPTPATELRHLFSVHPITFV